MAGPRIGHCLPRISYNCVKRPDGPAYPDHDDRHSATVPMIQSSSAALSSW